MKKTKILYVDDDPIHICLMCGIIGSSNFEVVSATSGEDAISILKKEPELKIIISDWVMPGINGVELVKHVNNVYPDKICYMMSGSSDADDLKVYENKGIIKKYFKKPINKEQFLKELDHINSSLILD